MGKEKFPNRISVGLTNEQSRYIDELVRLKWFDSQAQAIRYFLDQFDKVLPYLQKEKGCALPTVAESKKEA